jgi:hypothetical protein
MTIGRHDQNPKCTTCVQCGANMEATSGDLEDVLRVLEIAPTRAEAPNASVCRATLKEKYGSKRAKQLIDLLLEDRVIPATKAYHRRHMMLLDRKPLKPKTDAPQEEPIPQTN